VLAVSVVLAIFLRLFLPENQAGMLAVRSKSVDVAILTVLGVGLAIFALWVPAPN
jgi:multisubunit Na+/H+ antiporter MnhB subunit